MANAALRSFMEKVVSDPAMTEKLEALKQQYLMQIVSLAQETGIDLMPEDFADSAIPLEDGQIEAVTGGYNSLKLNPIHMKGKD